MKKRTLALKDDLDIQEIVKEFSGVQEYEVETLSDDLDSSSFYGDARVIDTHVKNIRRNLEVDYLKTIGGVGYKLKK